MSLSDALFGFVADFLVWCGQANSTGKTINIILNVFPYNHNGDRLLCFGGGNFTPQKIRVASLYHSCLFGVNI